MKNRDLLKQHMPIIISMILCWCLFFIANINTYRYVDGSYFFLWLISVVYLLFFLPFLYIQRQRIINNKGTEKINKFFKVINWIFIIIFLVPVVYDLLFYGFFGPFYSEPGFSFFQAVYYNILAFFWTFDFYNVEEFFYWFFYSLPYLIIIFLLWRSTKFDKLNRINKSN